MKYADNGLKDALERIASFEKQASTGAVHPLFLIGIAEAALKAAKEADERLKDFYKHVIIHWD